MRRGPRRPRLTSSGHRASTRISFERQVQLDVRSTLREMAPEIPLVLEAPRRGALRPYEELLHRGFDLGCRAGRDAYPVTIVSVERRDDWPATASSPHTARRAGRHV